MSFRIVLEHLTWVADFTIEHFSLTHVRSRGDTIVLTVASPFVDKARSCCLAIDKNEQSLFLSSSISKFVQYEDHFFELLNLPYEQFFHSLFCNTII